MSTAALNPEVLERAKECIAGRSRSYVEDAKLFARLLLDFVEAAKQREEDDRLDAIDAMGEDA